MRRNNPLFLAFIVFALCAFSMIVVYVRTRSLTEQNVAINEQHTSLDLEETEEVQDEVKLEPVCRCKSDEQSLH